MRSPAQRLEEASVTKGYLDYLGVVVGRDPLTRRGAAASVCVQQAAECTSKASGVSLPVPFPSGLVPQIVSPISVMSIHLASFAPDVSLNPIDRCVSPDTIAIMCSAAPIMPCCHLWLYLRYRPTHHWYAWDVPLLCSAPPGLYCWPAHKTHQVGPRAVACLFSMVLTRTAIQYRTQPALRVKCRHYPQPATTRSSQRLHTPLHLALCAPQLTAAGSRQTAPGTL